MHQRAFARRFAAARLRAWPPLAPGAETGCARAGRARPARTRRACASGRCSPVALRARERGLKGPRAGVRVSARVGAAPSRAGPPLTPGTGTGCARAKRVRRAARRPQACETPGGQPRCCWRVLREERRRCCGAGAWLSDLNSRVLYSWLLSTGDSCLSETGTA